MYLFFKRLLDVIMALVMVIILSPVIITVAIYLMVALRGTAIIFRQRRAGYSNKPFNVYKFKTMLDTKDADGKLLPDEQRLTKTGIMLRKYSLDELPQLFNILNGTMSFIGPRPLLVDYLPLYTYRHLRRHEVLPGISGWAQVNGRNAISWEQKFEYDVWYADNMSWRLDMKIMWLTIARVFRSEGISQEGHATMQKFTGNTVI